MKKILASLFLLFLSVSVLKAQVNDPNATVRPVTAFHVRLFPAHSMFT
ncbi:MAG: hypothetical protein IPP93_07220 [Chitinophagaceae bacterium]|nr:hypothetical protein [Chitinophagaceae bacterium]